MGEIAQVGIDLIKKWEGFFANAYDDGEGVWTIGYGTIRWDLKTPVKKGETITKEEAERQLRKELQRVEDAIDAAIKIPLNACEYSALCSFGYNVGIGWITGIGHQQATFIKKLNAGDRGAVPKGLLQFVRGANSGKAYAGLLNRRKDEVRLWLTPEVEAEPAQEHDDKPPMPQAVVPNQPSMVSVAQGSSTIHAALVAIGGTLLQAWSWLFGVAKEAAPDAVANQQSLSFLDALFKAVGANMGLIAAAVVLGSLVVVILKRLAREKA